MSRSSIKPFKPRDSVVTLRYKCLQALLRAEREAGTTPAYEAEPTVTMVALGHANPPVGMNSRFDDVSSQEK